MAKVAKRQLKVIGNWSNCSIAKIVVLCAIATLYFVFNTITMKNLNIIPKGVISFSNKSNNCDASEFDLTMLVFIKPVELHVKRLETILLPSLELFWKSPPLNVVFVTDPEAIENNVTNQIESLANSLLPSFANWSIKYTQHVTARKGSKLIIEKNKQLPKFWSDNYTQSEYIGMLDTDTLFVTPVTSLDLFVDGKPLVRGAFGVPTAWFVIEWAKTIESILGVEYIANFMVYFPVIFKRQDFGKVRKYVQERNNLTFFDTFTDIISTSFSEFTIIGNYLWHFEHGSYFWVLDKPPNVKNNVNITTSIGRYLKRRIPSVSSHFSRVTNRLKVESNVVMATGICYALKANCSNVVNCLVNNTCYEKVNKFEWFFESQDLSLIDPEAALQSHQQRMKRIYDCNFHWPNHTLFEIIKNGISWN